MATSGHTRSRKRLSTVPWDRVLGYVWVCALGASLLLSGQTAYRRAMQVQEYALGCDPFGYLTMAREFRQAASKLELPQFSLESTQTRVLIELMRSHHTPLHLWDELVAPHAHHFFPEAGWVGVQYPPGAGLALAFFPEGKAIHGLNQTVIGLFIAGGLLLLLIATTTQAWIAAGFVTLALHLGLKILGRIGTDSFSINAILAPLFLSGICVYAVRVMQSATKKLWMVWTVAFFGGSLLGFAIMSRLPVLFLVPGFLVYLWTDSWRPHLRDAIVPFCLGVLLIGVLPVLVHQERLAGGWYLSTYGRSDTALPSLAALKTNLSFYLVRGRGSKDNWALALLLVGLGGLIALGAQQAPTGGHLTWRRLMLSTLIMWGLPMLYFLTHPISIGYYAIPGIFGTVTLLALGGLSIESSTPKGVWRAGWERYPRLGWIALTLALLPGFVTLGSSWSFYAGTPNKPPLQARQLTLPVEMSEERAWVWADLLTGTMWYYVNKPAFKIGFTDTETRALVYRSVFKRGEPQYIIRDSSEMQRLMDEVSTMGGRLERRGEVETHPYFLIHWPEGGPLIWEGRGPGKD
jgi:hypothetical protein